MSMKNYWRKFMCQFPLFETISIIDGQVQNLAYHQARFDYAMNHYFHTQQAVRLADLFAIPEKFIQGNVRCRIDYNTMDFQVNYYAYQPRKIECFECVYVENLDYQFKYADREQLDSLKTNECDEIIIINNGFVSDCTVGNLLFYKENTWYSPNSYLLKGTQLSKLIDENKITLTEIKAENIFEYEKIMMINALNPFDESRAISITKSSIKI